jgi:hypothetical protein
MGEKIRRLLKLADRVLLYLEHRRAPEYETTNELRSWIDEPKI